VERTLAGGSSISRPYSNPEVAPVSVDFLDENFRAVKISGELLFGKERTITLSSIKNAIPKETCKVESAFYCDNKNCLPFPRNNYPVELEQNTTIQVVCSECDAEKNTNLVEDLLENLAKPSSISRIYLYVGGNNVPSNWIYVYSWRTNKRPKNCFTKASEKSVTLKEKIFVWPF
jgi:hypothetical protein